MMEISVSNDSINFDHESHAFLFDFERNFNYSSRFEWMNKNWTVSFYIAAIYLAIVFSLRKFMEDKKKLDLRISLFLWNTFLAIFSICGTIRGLPVIYHILSHHGIVFGICDVGFYTDNPVSSFWSYVFCMSKVPELFDTIFIILRKQPFTFLHWYHHITVMIYCFYSYGTQSASSGVFGMFNMMVHAFMYTYYAFTTLKIRIPTKVRMFITTLQLMQMVVGCTINYIVYSVLQRGEDCKVTMDNIKYSALMYFTYTLLFSHFFYQVYIARRPLKPMQKQE